MASPQYETALIVGVGSGLSASLARLLAREGMRVALAARNTDKLTDLCAQTGAQAFACDATDPAQVASLFEEVERSIGVPDVVVFNASGRARGPLIELNPERGRTLADRERLRRLPGGQQAARRMVPNGHGAILFTGASASVKGYAQSAPFAMGKFALRGLAHSMARELAPLGIYVGHFVIDGVNSKSGRSAGGKAGNRRWTRTPSRRAILYAETAAERVDLEIELRPWVEKF